MITINEEQGKSSYVRNIQTKFGNPSVTLSDIKNHMPKKGENCDYYVKTIDDEGDLGFVHCENDFTFLPMIEGRIILECYYWMLKMIIW